MSEFHLPMGWLPLVVAAWLPLSFNITYLIAVYYGHVYPWFPTISGTGSLPPESCWFSTFTNITCLLVVFTGYIRHTQLAEYSRCRKGCGPQWRTNLIASLAGLLSAGGMLLVANFQLIAAPQIHGIGVNCCFFAGIIYLIFQTIFSYWTAPELNSLSIFVLRALITVTMLIFVIAFIVVGHTAKNQFTGGDIAETLQWLPSQPGYRWHLANAAMEWALLLLLSLNFLTYYPDFKKIRLEEPILKMKNKWLNEF